MRRKKSGCFGRFLFFLFVLVVLAAAAFYYVNPDGLENLLSKYESMIGKSQNFEEITIKQEELEGRFYFN